ncbi:cornifelin homolog [Styela clava]
MATRLGESALHGCCCGFHFSSVVRPYIRAKHNIQGSLMEDCCMSCWCHSCNMCQISRELDRRSYPKGCLF